MELAFSRGFCHGWLDGPQPRSLVSGTSSAKRGTHLGEVKAVRGGRVAVRLAGPVRRGDGVVFEGDRAEGTETGGRVYEIFQDGRPVKEAAAGGLVELAFRHGTIQSGNVRPGQKVWKTDDPQAARRLRKSYAADRPCRRVPVDVAVEAAVGSVLRVTATAATGAACRLESPEALAEAVKHPLDRRDARRAVRPARQHALPVAPAGGEARRPGDGPLERVGNAAARDGPPVAGRCRPAAATERRRRVAAGRAPCGSRRLAADGTSALRSCKPRSCGTCQHPSRPAQHRPSRSSPRPLPLDGTNRSGARLRRIERDRRFSGPRALRRRRADRARRRRDDPPGHPAHPQTGRGRRLRVRWPAIGPTGCWCGTWRDWASAAAPDCPPWPTSRSMPPTT